MSTFKRIVSGSAAAWLKIIITLIGQLALVPLLLNRWSVEEYGCWLLIQSIAGLSTILSFGHQNFIGFEFLKCGKEQVQRLSLIFYSAIPYAILIGLIELLIIVGVIYFDITSSIFNPDNNLNNKLISEVNYALFIQSFVWLLVSSVGGLAGRLLSPLGYYPRNAWWGVIGAFLLLTTTVVIVLLGGGLLQTVYSIAIVNILYNLIIYIDFWRLFNKHGIKFEVVDWVLGANNLIKSLVIAINTFFELLRQQGLRIFLSAIIGIKQMTAFSTMRTASNIALQGVGTINNPIFPELMKYLQNKDQEHINSIIAFIWIITVIILSPILVVIQIIMPVIFELWTQGKVLYDPFVFGIFSISLIVYALSQPAVSIVKGNNLLRIQVFITIVVSLIVIFGIIFISPIYGMRGTSVILLISEIVSCFNFIFFSKKWLFKRNMDWPLGMFFISLISVICSSFIILALDIIPENKIEILSLYFILELIIIGTFFRYMPNIAKEKLILVISKFI